MTPAEWPRETYAAKQLAVVTAVVDALPGVPLGINLWPATSTLGHVQIRVHGDQLAANLATLCRLAQAIAFPAPEHMHDFADGAPGVRQPWGDWGCYGELAGLLVRILTSGPLAHPRLTLAEALAEADALRESDPEGTMGWPFGPEDGGALLGTVGIWWR